MILRYFTTLRLMIRLIFFALGLCLLVPLIKILMPFYPEWAYRICTWVHSYSCWCFNVRVEHIGEPVGHCTVEPVLYVINHISWIDIIVVGRLIKGNFVAKAELENWPVLGGLADLQNTIYIKREERHRTADQKNNIADRLAGGNNVLLFPEGTSGLGHIILPFKSSLFGITDDPRLTNLIIQPVTLSYTHLNGLPLLRAQRAIIAWVGDMGFGSHAALLLSQSSLQALVQFHAPVRRGNFDNRKMLCAACEDVISSGLQLANAGRIETAVAAALPNRLSSSSSP
jgi:lyso-ornithine lipid O-acyltransferase